MAKIHEGIPREKILNFEWDVWIDWLFNIFVDFRDIHIFQVNNISTWNLKSIKLLNNQSINTSHELYSNVLKFSHVSIGQFNQPHITEDCVSLIILGEDIDSFCASSNEDWKLVY